MDACDSLRKLSLAELEAELEEIEEDYKRKILSTKDFYECREMVLKVLEEKRLEQNVTDAYKRAMAGI